MNLVERLAVVGVGLLGGSVAKAVRAAGAARAIVGIGRDASRLEAARRDGTLDDVTTDLVRGVRDADLVVLATPVQAIETLLPSLAGAVTADALVTDVGSTKAAIVRAAEALARARPFAFVGSHPMAGSERAGYAVARADLFSAATVIVTPTAGTEASALKRIIGFWETLGARVVTMDPESHDLAVAAISHLPHAVAFALVEAVARFQPDAFAVAARGFRDTTRIAASDPVVWQEIFAANRPALRAALAVFRGALDDLERLVASGDATALQRWIDGVRARRESVA